MSKRKEGVNAMRQKIKHGLVLSLCLLLLCIGVPVHAVSAKNKVDDTSEMKILKQFRPEIDVYYNFEVEEAQDLRIFNRDITDSKVVYMEYEVSDVEDLTTLTGFSLYNNTTNFTKAFEAFTTYKEGKKSPMLVEGAKYYICFAKRDNEIEIYAQRTVNGVSENVKMQDMYGEYNKDYNYFTLAFGSEYGHTVTCKFKNFRCYDANGKDLGVQLGQAHASMFKIDQMGMVDDSEEFEGVYYCKEKPELGLIALGKDFSGYQELNGKKANITYRVFSNGSDEAALHISSPSGKEIYDYRYLQIIDGEKNVYTRLRNVKATFVVDETTSIEEVTAKNGYHIQKPQDPTKEGDTFVGWYLGNGKEYDFNSIATESITLYAKWESGQDKAFVDVEDTDFAPDEHGNEQTKTSVVPVVIAISSSLILIVAGIVGSILVIRRKRHVKEEAE